ncbi:hypothetical protein BN946_scf185013.g38 [Trametes cinnabarina]|uniref:Uncharacterized protein n=1 Tax=Pycnoporus cinnabarinus TaxID=5643 RepID=A0A060SMF8_PYCCI|nr:hypothetical protein BN946_scf185013.g38 [Trametes cinnabarina]
MGTALWRASSGKDCTSFPSLLNNEQAILSLIIIAVTCLAIGQFVIEYLDCAPERNRGHDAENMKERLLSSHSEDSDDRFDVESSSSYPPAPSRPRTTTRPRSKSKPDDIFIHPNDSNLARADAAAAQLGLAGDTERVKANVYPADEDPWEHGRGKEVARELLLGR